MELDIPKYREVVYNKLLPYSKSFDDDAARLINEVKTNLGKAIMMRELRPGASLWAERLSRYIRCYGLKFSKDDHINFIHLFYELVTIPMLDPTLLFHFSETLLKLLKRKGLISPEELTLQWKPLFDVCQNLFFEKEGVYTAYQYHSNLRSTYISLIHSAKPYFPLNATAEILDRLLPIICPYDHSRMNYTIAALEWFLPITLYPEMSGNGYRLWFEDLMKMWDMYTADYTWEQDLMWLMARLARHNIGYVDWEPYMDLMFHRILRSFQLPVYYKKQKVFELLYKIMDTSAVALWIVNTLGGNSSCQMHLEKLMSQLAVYYYPTNQSGKLIDFIQELCLYFLQRLNLERYKKRTWETHIKSSHLLSEDDITKFVETLKPHLMAALYTRRVHQVSEAIHHLATVRPNIMFVPVLEKFNQYEGCMTEPHKLLATMNCLVALARPMVEGYGEGFPLGRLSVIPLMMSFLPAIDSNDHRKTITAFTFYSTMFSLVPIVDCSQASMYWSDLTEDEKELCALTSQFEDFVMKFLERCFILISNSQHSSRSESFIQKRNSIEESFNHCLHSVVTSLLVQTSPSIFNSAFRKLMSFLRENMFEDMNIAGDYAGSVAQCFAFVNPHVALGEIIPWLCSEILERTEAPEVALETNLDNSLLYYMLVLARVICTHHVLPHVPLLTTVLDRILKLNAVTGNMFACEVLANLMSSLTKIVPEEHRSTPGTLNHDIKDYLPIRDWGKCGNIDNLQVKWFVPGPDEVEAVKMILYRYLPEQLEMLKDYSDEKIDLPREVLNRSLNTIIGLLCCKPMLPVWNEPPIVLVESWLEPRPFVFTKGLGPDAVVTMPNGENVRKHLAQAMDALQKRMMKKKLENSKAYRSLLLIWQCLLNDTNPMLSAFDASKELYQPIKKAQRNVLLGEKKHMRSILIQRAQLQIDFQTETSVVPMTETHRLIMENLFMLSISSYKEIRNDAQHKLYAAFEMFMDSYLSFTDKVVEYLEMDPEEAGYDYAGFLQLIKGEKIFSILHIPHWNHLRRIWPAILRAKPSEERTVTSMIQLMSSNVPKCTPTIGILFKVPNTCVELARKFVTEEMPEDEGLRVLERRNKFNLDCYRELETAVNDALVTTEMHNRWRWLAVRFLRCLLHPELPYSARSVEYFVSALINEDIYTRKVAYKIVPMILDQYKAEKVEVPLESRLCPAENLRNKQLRHGARDDNAWLLYNKKNRPAGSKDWEKPRFSYELHIGYAYWPQVILVAAPPSQQQDVDREYDDLSEGEQIVDYFFSDPSNIETLMKFLSLEENKGTDKFDVRRAQVFKALFLHFGDRHLPLILPYLEQYTKSKQESVQRAAAEIISGIVRGSKYWPYNKVVAMWDDLLPIYVQIFNNMSPEVWNDWSASLAVAMSGQDPNRIHWLVELLATDLIRDEPSHRTCGRVLATQSALMQMRWRIPEVYTRILEAIRPHLDYKYQNVRDRLGSLLSSIFEEDRYSPEDDGAQTHGVPRIAELVDHMLHRLEPLTHTPPALVAGASGFALPMSTEILKPLQELSIQKPEKQRKGKFKKSDSQSSSKESDSDSDRQSAKHLLKKGASAIASPIITGITKPLEQLSIHMSEHDHKGKSKKGDRHSSDKEVIVDSDRQSAIRLLTTVCRWICNSIGRSPYGISPYLCKFIPFLCMMEGTEEDDDLGKSCTKALQCLCYVRLMPQHVPVIISALQDVASLGTWTARRACLDFIQVYVFANSFVLIRSKIWIDQLVQIVMNLLQDEWVDIRDKACETLSALFLTNMIEDTGAFLEQFKEQAGCGKRKKKGRGTMSPADVAKRHAGVLGICAYIYAHPYTIPEQVPGLLVYLSTHLFDPAPISSAVTKCFTAFKRSHRNMLGEMDGLDEELADVLREGSVPPSYIA